MKNFFKGQNKKLQKATEPRSMDEIRKEYNQLLAAAGNAQYLVFVHTKEAEQLNQRLLEINNEAGLRQKLDTEATKQVEETKGAADAQS